DRDLPPLLRAPCLGGDRHDRRGRDRAGGRFAHGGGPAGAGGRRRASARRDDPPERGTRHEHGDDGAEVTRGGEGRPDLPRHHRAAGARSPRAPRRAAAARADEQLPHARADAGGSGALPELDVGLPLDFVQGRVPKIRADDLTPVEWPADPELEWTPPGHGDIYTSLMTSGMLATLLDQGFEYALMANSDNLGAVLDPRVLAWFAREELPFAMEVLRRSPADRKGGHIARRQGGGLVLRESAQVRDEDQDAFQDVGRHRYFNTNNLWVNLRTLKRVLGDRGGVLGLPMIVNRKTVDPSDSSSPAVFQLETAMGAAIDVFEGAAALLVGRPRFAPVKTTNDLLVLRSDAYELDEDYAVELAAARR